MDVNGSASRKPSGSSSHSAGHSPNASPGAAASRRLASGGSGTLFGIGMKNLNNGWQVWPPGATSNAQRAASASSSVSNVEAGGPGSESLSRQLGEQWSAPRPAASSAWDMAGNGLDANGSPHKKDSGQLLARQRQATTPHATALSTPRSVSLPSAGEELAHSLLESDDRQGKGLSQQRFDNTANKTFSTNASPQNKPSPYTHSSFQYPNVSSLYASNGTSGYDLNGSAPMDEVTQGLRAMTVQDPYNSSFRVDQNLNNVQNGHISLPQQIRPPVPPVRAPSYNTYPQQSEFPTTYYGNGPDNNIYVSPHQSNSVPSFGGGYPTLASQPHAHGSHEQQATPPMYFEYQNHGRISSAPYYYGHQPVLYHAATPHSPVPPVQMPAMMAPMGTYKDKKRDFGHVGMQQNLLIGPAASNGALYRQPDYGAQAPVMIGPASSIYPRAALGPTLQGYSQGPRFIRQGDTTQPPAHARSVLLEEFRSNKTRKWELKDLFGYIVEFSGDQHGSRFIQQKLESATVEERQKVFDEIVPHSALQLMQDVFGNYVVQKLLEHGTQVQRNMVAGVMDGHIMALSLHMYACRVVQKAIEHILPEQQASIVRELEDDVLKCVKDANGNHVIQKLIQCVTPERLGFVGQFRTHVYELSTHPYGCRVLQRCFEHLRPDQTRPLLDELHRHVITLMQDSFGNYVVQWVLLNGSPEDVAFIASQLRGQMLQMAKHKFASNVCERALAAADPERKRLLIEEIMTPLPDGTIPIAIMMKDQYANYVLQRAMKLVGEEQKEALFEKVRPQLTNMRRYSSAYSKHLNSIDRILSGAE